MDDAGRQRPKNVKPKNVRKNAIPENIRPENIEGTGNNRELFQRSIRDISKIADRHIRLDNLVIDGKKIKLEGRNIDAKKTKEGLLIPQLQTSNNITLTASNNHYSMINEENHVEFHGLGTNFSMKEIGSNKRQIATYSYPQGFQRIEMGEDNPEATIGNLKLKQQADGSLQIETNEEETGVEGVREKITINGRGKDRNLKYEYVNKLESTYFNAEVISANKSMKETDDAKKEYITKYYEGKFDSGTAGAIMRGAIRKIIFMPHLTVIVPENWPGEVSVSPGVTVEA